MRTTVIVVLVFSVVVIACGQAPKPQAPVDPRTALIEVDAKVSERLQLGLPMQVELRAGNQQVGACTMQFDLWEEHYKASRSRTELGRAPDADGALRHCIETPVTATIRVRELAAEPAGYQPRAAYPVF
jgi:hypothetical protein